MTGIRFGSRRFLGIYTIHFAAPAFDHAFFATPKLLLQGTGISLRHLLVGYLAIATCTMLSLYVFRIRHLPLINQLLLLLVCCVALPPTSFDYT